MTTIGASGSAPRSAYKRSHQLSPADLQAATPPKNGDAHAWGTWLQNKFDNPPPNGVIIIPPGRYDASKLPTGQFVISKPNVRLITNPASNSRATLVGSKSRAIGTGLADAATLKVEGANFSANRIEIRNDYDRKSHLPNPALALFQGGTLTDCTLQGFQDTLYAKGGTTTINGGGISGAVDFICNEANSTIQVNDSTINCLPNPGYGGHIVAPKGKVTIKDSRINGWPNEMPAKYFLARPWPSAGGYVTTGSVLYDNCFVPKWLEFDPACTGPGQPQGAYQKTNCYDMKDIVG